MKMVFAALLTAGLMIAGAAPAPAAELKFAETVAYNVDASAFTLVNQDQTPREYPQVGHLSPVTFDTAIRTWAERRFKLTGNSVNTLRVTVREARITETILPIQKGFKGWFKKEEAVKYEAALNLEIAIVDANGERLSHAESSAWVSQSLLEGATQEKKQAAWVDLINSAFNNIDRELKVQLPQYMNAYIR